MPIGAVVDYSDSGQIKLVDDDGEVYKCIIHNRRMHVCMCVYIVACMCMLHCMACSCIALIQ